MITHAEQGPLARVLELLRAHDERETSVLVSYEELVENTSDDGVRYLGRLIIEDEKRHHQVISEMANRVESWMQGEPVEPSTPELAPRVDRELLEETHRLVGLERDDLHELHLLKRSLHDVPPASLLPLLVELMIHDAGKHVEILEFIRAYTG